uniref:Uncharacterized protein n=1 Tax=Oryza sativa subsp. japonica TaxID=39947 RepID=Q6K435_ORYSJ|nr:hypothetical protein [Oryza sativa Japonica Group]
MDKVFQPLPSLPSTGHDLLFRVSVRSGESVFRPLPSLPSVGQSAPASGYSVPVLFLSDYPIRIRLSDAQTIQNFTELCPLSLV